MYRLNTGLGLSGSESVASGRAGRHLVADGGHGERQSWVEGYSSFSQGDLPVHEAPPNHQNSPSFLLCPKGKGRKRDLVQY